MSKIDSGANKKAVGSTTSTSSGSSSNKQRMINLNSVLNDLICSVCLDFFAQPRTLSCQHTFCSKCLQPLIKDKVITCPQCRRETPNCESIEQVPKNILLANLVESIQTAKAACPSCHELTVLNQCDHCSHIFCEKCLQKHVFDTLSGLEARLSGAVDLSTRLEGLKERVDGDEHEALQRLINEADIVQSQIVNVFMHRKAALFAEAKRFYRSKLEEIERAQFRLKASLSNKEELKTRLSAARHKAERLYAIGDEIKKEASDDVTTLNDAFVKEISNLETQIDAMDASVRDLLPSIDSKQQELRLEYNQVEAADAYKKLIESMRIVTIDPSNQTCHKNEESNLERKTVRVDLKCEEKSVVVNNKLDVGGCSQFNFTLNERDDIPTIFKFPSPQKQQPKKAVPTRYQAFSSRIWKK